MTERLSLKLGVRVEPGRSIMSFSPRFTPNTWSFVWFCQLPTIFWNIFLKIIHNFITQINCFVFIANNKCGNTACKIIFFFNIFCFDVGICTVSNFFDENVPLYLQLIIWVLTCGVKESKNIYDYIYFHFSGITDCGLSTWLPQVSPTFFCHVKYLLKYLIIISNSVIKLFHCFCNSVLSLLKPFWWFLSAFVTSFLLFEIRHFLKDKLVLPRGRISRYSRNLYFANFLPQWWTCKQLCTLT